MDTLASSQFPDGNLMIQQNSADFYRSAIATLNDSSSSSWEVADAKQWLGANSQFAQTYDQLSGSNVGSLIGTVLGSVYSSNSNSNSSESKDNSSDTSNDTGFWSGLWNPVQKWGTAAIAIIIGIVLLAVAIFIYHEK